MHLEVGTVNWLRAEYFRFLRVDHWASVLSIYDVMHATNGDTPVCDTNSWVFYHWNLIQLVFNADDVLQIFLHANFVQRFSGSFLSEFD